MKKTTNTTVYARNISRKLDATIKIISRKFSRMNEAQQLRAMQLIANMDDIRAFDSIARNSFTTRTEL
jgi:predicted alpha/beta-fold hydrolase